LQQLSHVCRERQDAFDLRAALADHVKFLERQRKGLESSDTFQIGTEDAPVSVALTDILKPLSIAAGETLRLTVKSVSDRPRAEASADASIAPPVSKGLRPPPKAGPAVTMTSPVVATAPPVSADDDDWGDFQSS
jgi:hypothetical protein